MYSLASQLHQMSPEDLLFQWKRTINVSTNHSEPKRSKNISFQTMTTLLKSAETHLTSLENIDTEQVDIGTINNHKDSLEKILNYFTDEICDSLRCKLISRKRKQSRNKAAKKIRQEEMNKKDKVCSKWLQEKQEEELRTRLEKAVELEAADSLMDVKKKQQDMKYYKDMLECLKALRELRRTKRDKGELPPIKEDEKFSQVCIMLDDTLSEYTEVYKKEEHALRVMMSKQVDNEMIFNKTNQDNIMMPSINELSVEEYYNTNDASIIETRRANWDNYISTDGSPLPPTWVEPAVPSNEVWSYYLQ